MSDIIETWLKDSLGLVVSMDPAKFACTVMDGTVIARLLRKYNVITEDQFASIIPTDSRTISFRNMQHISNWLKAADIHCSNEYLLDISTGKSYSAVKIFYQLYLALHDKDKFDYIVNWKAKQKMHVTRSQIKVTHVPEDIPDPSRIHDNYLSDQLTSHAGEINWGKDRYQHIVEQYEEMREKYAKYVREKFDTEYRKEESTITDAKRITNTPQSLLSSDAESICEFQDFTYEELAKQEVEAKHKPPFVPNANDLKRILSVLKQRSRSEKDEKESMHYQQKMLLINMWSNALAQQEAEFEDSVSKTLLQQSEYEKQMTTKMLEVRQQERNILENRRLVDAEIARKSEEEYLESEFLKKKSLTDLKFKYYLEKDRVLELHRKLYQKKMILKAEKSHGMCLDAVKDIVNVALRHVEYKETYNEDVPKRVEQEWKNLFVKQQVIFDLAKDIEDIVDYTGDLPPDVEEIFTLETQRQDALDDREFENYSSYEYSWSLDNISDEHKADLNSIELFMNVLGHVVHRVLLCKYPTTKPYATSGISKSEVSACVNGLTDTSILPVLQRLLNYKGVKVIILNDAINHCLKIYQNEAVSEDIDNILIQATSHVFEGAGQAKTEPPKKGVKNTPSKNKIAAVEGPDSVREGPMFVEKECQTPKKYPCEEVVLNISSELGKTAYELLNLGDELTDNLVVAMFVEYLKSLPNLTGWVLIDFPTTIKQAALLEEALTGIPVPFLLELNGSQESPSIGDISDLDCRDSHFDQNDLNKILRTCKILPNPTYQHEEPFYETYLTAFIDVKCGTPDSEPDGDDSLLSQFYSKQGCNYVFYYKTMGFEAIKHLAKLIIGDYTIPRKTSLQLFGDTVLYMEANHGQHRGTPGLEAQSNKKGEKKEIPVAKQESEPVVEIVSVADKSSEIPVDDLLPAIAEPRAGEPFWQYSDCGIPDFLEKALSTFWENCERTYVSDLKQTFFINRVNMNAIMPYLNHIRRYVENFITRPDNKRVLLSEFQTIYNEFDNDMRDDDEFKAELHCRISEVRERLREICDKSMQESESLRQEIACNGWLVKQLAELANNAVCQMQLECDRCCNSLQFLTDYYSAIITKMPSDEPLLEVIMLAKLFTSSQDTRASPTISEINGKIEQMLIVYGTSSSVTPFHKMLETTLATSTAAVDKWHLTCTGICSRMNAYFQPGKKVPPPKSSGKNAIKLPRIEEPEPEVKEAGSRLIQEWEVAVNGERKRAKLRLNLLLAKAFCDLNECLNAGKKTFYHIYDVIKNRYGTEMGCVDIACEVLAKAVEAEIAIQPQMVLEGDKFYVAPDFLMFPEELPPAEPPTRETCYPYMFTVEQLNNLSDILYDLAPNGSVIERVFVFLLQDMIVQNAEDGKECMAPRTWQNLKPQQVSRLSKEIYGNIEYIDWKEFIIHSLCLPYPSEQTVLKTLSLFRENDPDLSETVKDYQYYSIKLWFEGEFTEEPSDVLRLKLIKELLFKLFSIDEDTLNYTALLLAFCKDENLVKGLAKALAVSFGKCVCWDLSEGSHYVSSVLSHRQIEDEKQIYHELSHLETELECQSILNSIVDDTVHVCDSVVIEDHKSNVDLYLQASEQPKHESSIIDVEFLHFSKTSSSTECIEDNEEKPKVEVAREVSYFESKVYFMAFDSILNVLAAAMPWHMREQTLLDDGFRCELESIFNNLRDPMFNHCVLTHQLLNDNDFKKLLSKVAKFYVVNVPKLVAQMVEENKVV